MKLGKSFRISFQPLQLQSKTSPAEMRTHWCLEHIADVEHGGMLEHVFPFSQMIIKMITPEKTYNSARGIQWKMKREAGANWLIIHFPLPHKPLFVPNAGTSLYASLPVSSWLRADPHCKSWGLEQNLWGFFQWHKPSLVMGTVAGINQ